MKYKVRLSSPNYFITLENENPNVKYGMKLNEQKQQKDNRGGVCCK